MAEEVPQTNKPSIIQENDNEEDNGDENQDKNDTLDRYDVTSPMLNKDLELNELNNLRHWHVRKILIGHLNINSVRNKFSSLKEIVEKNLDIFMISETKIGNSYPSEQFMLNGFSKPYRLDRTDHGGGLLLYVRQDIPSSLVKSEESYEAIFVEATINKKKWLISFSYNPNEKNTQEHLKKLETSLDRLARRFNNLLVIGDLNCEIDKHNMPDFCESFDLKSLINIPTCFKNPENPKCIDHMLTDSPSSFSKVAYTVLTGFSDFHRMTVAVLNTAYTKQPPKTIKYRCFRNFDENKFDEVLSGIVSEPDLDFETKSKMITTELDKAAPFKTKKIRGNNAPFMTKEMRKAIMTRSKLKNRWLKQRSKENKARYNRQRNYCLSLLRQTKSRYFARLEENKITDARKFWKTVKPFFSNKSTGNTGYTLIENNEIINDEEKIAQVFGNFYRDIIPNLNLPIPPYQETNSQDYVEKCIIKYRDHPSITEIKNKGFNKAFNFKHSTKEEVEKIIKKLVTNKSQPSSDIPVKIIKRYSSTFADFIFKNINSSIDLSYFPDVLKIADITPVYKQKGKKSDKTNYRPISILPVVSKIYERIIHDQISDYFANILSEKQCAYRKGFSTQPALMTLVEIWKKATDDKKKFGALLIDLSKAFDCICHDLLIAKMDAYGLDKNAMDLIAEYLSRRKQRVKIGSHYSTLHDVKDGVPQGSILGPLLFNIYTRDLFYVLDQNVLNYADDTTPFAVGVSWDEVTHELESAAKKIFEWLGVNQMIGNAGKSELILNTTNEDIYITVLNQRIYNSNSAKILGIVFDNKLEFEKYISKICNEASKKISALARIAPFMNESKRKKLMNAFFKCHFSYCPLVWMFHSRALKNRINHLHERCLRIVYRDDNSSFEDLLAKDESSNFHQRNLQYLSIELFKNAKGLCNQSSGIFVKNTHNSDNDENENEDEDIERRNLPFFKSRHVRTVFNGEESLSYLAPKIWELVPSELKDLDELEDFKKKIKHWRTTSCPCRNCKVYIQGVGFIENIIN